jgi:hypothetical protein
MRCLTSLARPMDAEGICKHLAGKVAERAAGADRFDDTTILALSVMPTFETHAMRDDKLPASYLD